MNRTEKDLADKLPPEFRSDSLVGDVRTAAAQLKRKQEDEDARRALKILLDKWEELADQGLPASEIIRRFNKALGLPENFHPDDLEEPK